ncbi:MAG: S8 family serine peptidase [Bacteroidales bacterium]|nr:S8 family serine peptidase [Bacteroidales bacterium]
MYIKQVFNNYDVSSFKKAFPSARTPKLQDIYEVECDNIQLMQDLINWELYPYGEEIEEITFLYEPNDYGLELSQTNLDLMNLKSAWDITKGDASIIIGISDSYIEETHEDLQSQILTVISNGPMEWHGVAVTGCAVAATNNSLGISGIASNCKVNFICNNGTNPINTMLLLSQSGARVINASWINRCAYSNIDWLVFEEIKDNGTITVCGAGNSIAHCGSLDAEVFPASYDNCISVTSVGHMNPIGYTDSIYGQTNWKDVHEAVIGDPGTAHHHNTAVDICAPGYNVPSTSIGNTYQGTWGTSFASPQVAGICALILSVNPCLSRDEAVDILLSTAVDIDDIPENIAYNELLGSGRADAFEAMKKAYGNSETIYSGETIVWNSFKSINGTLLLQANSHLTINTRVYFNENSNIVVKNGASLVLESDGYLTSFCDKTWSVIIVEPGGIVELRNESIVNINGNGCIYVGKDTNYSSVLIFNQGAIINLVDNESYIEIKGNLSIAANAQFTFTGAGYIKFSNPGDMYTENITCGTGASMLFQGSGKSDKVVEVQQDAVRFPALESLTFEDCKIVMSAGDQMLATADYPITFDNVLMTSATGINGKHRGFCFYGQENTVVNNCIFEYSSYGITGDLSVYGSPLEVSNSEFRYNTNGIHIYGRGIHASFCNFNHCNSNGAYCYGMSLPSEFLNCEFHHNGHNGFTFYGSSAADLDVEACDIYSNIYDGIITSGAFDLRLSCNNIYANRYGVYTQNGTYVYAENNAENDIHSNVRSIYLNYGRLFLNEGYNQLQAATDAYAVYGFSVEPGNCSASPQNIANNNRWEADDTEGPDYGTNYKLWKFQCSNPLVLVQLVDSIPDYTVCYHIDPDSLQEGGSCFQSNEETANLLNSLPLISLSGGISLPLDQAVTYLANQSDGVSSANAFNNLIDEYANLIFQCDNNTSDAVFLLKNKAYGDVHNTLTNYYEFIDYNSGHNGFNQAVDRMVLLHEDLLINPDIPDYLSIEYKLDIAMLNYLRKDYNRSITQLEFLINEIPDTVNAKAFVENWLCFVSAEKALREGTILPEEYEQSIAECNINYPVTIFDSPDHDEVQNANSTSEETAQVSIAINPNPNQGSFTVLVTNSSISGKIMITKATGQPVYETILTFAEQLVAVNGLPAGTFTVYYIENGTVITSVGTIVE